MAFTKTAGVNYGAPDLSFGVADAEGSNQIAIRNDATLALYNTDNPQDVTTGAASPGSAETSSRIDHVHSGAIADTNDLVFIGTVVASNSATLTITGLDSTYDTYLLAGSALAIANDAVGFDMRFGDSGGIDSGASDYSYLTDNASAAVPAGGMNGSTGSDVIAMSVRAQGNASGEGIGFVLWLVQPGDSGQFNKVSGTFVYDTHDGAVAGGSIVARRNTAITLTQVQIFARTGNILTGRFSVWGLKHA